MDFSRMEWYLMFTVALGGVFFILFLIYIGKYREKKNEMEKGIDLFKSGLLSHYKQFSQDFAKCIVVLINAEPRLSERSRGKIEQEMDSLRAGLNTLHTLNYMVKNKSSMLAGKACRLIDGLMEKDGNLRAGLNDASITVVVAAASDLLSQIENLLKTPVTYPAELVTSVCKSEKLKQRVKNFLSRHDPEVEEEETETSEHRSSEAANSEWDENAEEIDSSPEKEPEKKKKEEKVDSSKTPKTANTGGGPSGSNQG